MKGREADNRLWEGGHAGSLLKKTEVTAQILQGNFGEDDIVALERGFGHPVPPLWIHH